MRLALTVAVFMILLVALRGTAIKNPTQPIFFCFLLMTQHKNATL